jgi:hypothetical protein
MGEFDAGMDITTDLNGQSSDAVPYHGQDVPQNQLPSMAPEAPAESPPESIRDALTQAFKKQSEPQAQLAPNSGAPAATAAPEPPTTPAPDLVKVGDVYRHADGRFASAAEVAAFNARPSGQMAAPPPEQNAPPPPFIQHLTPLEQQQFTALPAELRQFVERTMEDVGSRAARYGEYDALEQHIIGPRREAWAQGGMNPAVALNQLLNLSDFAGRDPGQFALWFADQHQLDLDALLDERDAQQGPQDPRLNGLQQEIAQLRNTIQGFVGGTAERETQENLQVVQTFAVEKDDKGALAHPYFAEVANDIKNYIPVVRNQQPNLRGQDVLKAAYDMAVWANPSTRARMQQAQMDALKAQAGQEAARARQAGSSISGGPAGDASSAPNNPSRSIRDEILHAYQQQTV